ncbi:MAG: type II toxin-antitoxin system VapC family toxin [Armatimonadota bacterium]
MKAVLLDTGVLLRERHVGDIHHQTVVGAIEKLVGTGWSIYTAPQCLQEYWAVATRPPEARGGLGLSVERAAEDIEQIISAHDVLVETAELFQVWRRIVTDYRVLGRQVWDARIAAIMQLHGIKHLLTFNTQDFVRFDFIRAWSPEDVDGLLQYANMNRGGDA